MLFYINLFFIYAIFGFLFETITMYLMKQPYNSSVLYGPWTMVYGFAVLVMIIVYFIVKRFNFNKLKEKIIYFFSITTVITLLEGISGYIIEFTQHKVYWNYDNLKFNIGHYMALEISLIWGLLSLFTIYFVIPKIKKIIRKIPPLVTYVAICLFIIDMLVSFFL